MFDSCDADYFTDSERMLLSKPEYNRDGDVQQRSVTLINLNIDITALANS